MVGALKLLEPKPDMFDEEPGPLDPVGLEFMRLDELAPLNPDPIPDRFMDEDEGGPVRLLVPAP